MSYFDEQASTWDQDALKVERARQTVNCVRKVNAPAQGTLVDFGAGTGLLGSMLTDRFAQVLLVDDSPAMLAVAQDKIDRAKVGNLFTYKARRLADITADVSALVTLMTLHHIVDVDEFFADAARLFAPGGLLMIADLYAEDGSFHQSRPDFKGHNGFEPEALANRANEYGFEFISVEHYFDMPKTMPDGQTRDYPLFFLVLKRR